MYKGVLRSGETYSAPFEELQIIPPETFDLAQKLMLERKLENKDERHIPLNTTASRSSQEICTVATAAGGWC